MGFDHSCLLKRISQGVHHQTGEKGSILRKIERRDHTAILEKKVVEREKILEDYGKYLLHEEMGANQEFCQQKIRRNGPIPMQMWIQS